YDKERAGKNKELEAQKKDRRSIAEAKLMAVIPRLTLAEVEKLRIHDINLQIRWHRRFDKDVPAAKNTPSTKAQKIQVLMDAVGRYIRGEAVPKNDAGPSESQQSAVGDNATVSHSEDESDNE
ncbi:hypothetical protein EDD22DRAFT_781243, partial [Suillus occidentalis]